VNIIYSLTAICTWRATWVHEYLCPGMIQLLSIITTF